MEQDVLAFMKQQKMTHEGKRLLLACSGGADSVALVRFFHNHASHMNWTLGIVHADHQLRGTASTEDRLFVEALGKELDIPVYSHQLPVPERLKKGGNTQQVCREERYTYFASVLHTYAYDVLAFGHHADDQIETVLMGLAKGLDLSSPGIPLTREWQGKILIRPFLGVTRKTIEQYLHTVHQSYREDASNASDTYTRNRFRHHIIPLFYQESPAFDHHIQRFVEARQQDEEVLMALATEKFEQFVTDSSSGSVTLDNTTFSEMAIALQRRVILLLWKYLQPEGPPLSSSLVSAIVSVCQNTEGSQKVSLPRDFQLIRAYQTVRVARQQVDVAFTEEVLPLDRWVQVAPGVQLLITNNELAREGERWYANIDESDLPLRVRARQPGDLVDLGTHHKKVARLFIDSKVPVEKREGWPLLVTQKNGILGLIGLRYSKQLTKSKKTPWVIWIKQEDSTC